MGITSNNTKHDISWLAKNDANHNINYEISIQRREIWNLENKSNLIVSILLDIPIENLLFEEVDIEGRTKKFMVIDGKQRTTTICRFLRDEFPLSPHIKHYEFDGVDIRGMRFSELPQNLQDGIKDRELAITVVSSMTDDERALLFFMRNQAVQLTKMELSRADIGEPGMNRLNALIKHPFVQEKIKMTEPARKKYQDMQIFIEYLLLKKYGTETGFTPKEISSMCREIRKDPSIIEAEAVTVVLDYLNDAIPQKHTALRKVVLPIILQSAENAINQNVPHEMFNQWVENGLTKLYDNEDFQLSFKSYKKSEVQKRAAMIMENFYTFINAYPLNA